MKNITRTFASITVMLTVFFFASPTVCRAQSELDPANMIEVSAMPTNGIFCSMVAQLPPAPFDPLPALNLYTDGTTGVYYYDDREFDYWTYLGEAGHLRSGGRTMDDAPPLPGDGGGGGGGSSGGGGSPGYSFIPPTNGYVSCETWTNFWLEISAKSLNSSNQFGKAYVEGLREPNQTIH